MKSCVSYRRAIVCDQKGSPFLVHTAKVITAWDIQHQTDNRLETRGSIPPWEYKIHRISSISGWYAALSLGVSLSFGAADGGPASSSSSIGGPDPGPFKIGSRCSGRSAGCSWGEATEPLRSLARFCASCQSFLALIHSASNL